MNISNINLRKYFLGNIMFDCIDSEDKANKLIHEASILFYFVGIVEVLFSLLISTSYLIDTALYIILAFILNKYKSRFAAIILSLMASSYFIITMMNGLQLSRLVKTLGGSMIINIFVSTIALYSGIRSVEATFKLKRKERTSHVLGLTSFIVSLFAMIGIVVMIYVSQTSYKYLVNLIAILIVSGGIYSIISGFGSIVKAKAINYYALFGILISVIPIFFIGYFYYLGSAVK